MWNNFREETFYRNDDGIYDYLSSFLKFARDIKNEQIPNDL